MNQSEEDYPMITAKAAQGGKQPTKEVKKLQNKITEL